MAARCAVVANCALQETDHVVRADCYSQAEALADVGDCYLLSSLPLFQSPLAPGDQRGTHGHHHASTAGDVLSVDPGAVPVVLNTSRVLGAVPTFVHAPSMLHQVLRISSAVRSAAAQVAQRRAEAAKRAVDNETQRASGRSGSGGRGVVSHSPARQSRSSRRSKRSRRRQPGGPAEVASDVIGTPAPPPPGMLCPLDTWALQRLRRAAEVYDATILVFAKLGRRCVMQPPLLVGCQRRTRILAVRRAVQPAVLPSAPLLSLCDSCLVTQRGRNSCGRGAGFVAFAAGPGKEQGAANFTRVPHHHPGSHALYSACVCTVPQGSGCYTAGVRATRRHTAAYARGTGRCGGPCPRGSDAAATCPGQRQRRCTTARGTRVGRAGAHGGRVRGAELPTRGHRVFQAAAEHVCDGTPAVDASCGLGRRVGRGPPACCLLLGQRSARGRTFAGDVPGCVRPRGHRGFSGTQ